MADSIFSWKNSRSNKHQQDIQTDSAGLQESIDVLTKLLEEQHSFLFAAMQVARNPLTSILELTADLEESESEIDAMRIRPQVYFEKTLALQRLFDLSVLRLRAGRLLVGHTKEQVDIVLSMQNVKLSLLKYAAHKGIDVSSTNGDESPLLETDPQKLQFVINQLIVKAIEETAQGGKVLIKIDYPMQGNSQFVVFSIKNSAGNTKPMEEETLDDPFRRLESDIQKPTYLWHNILLVKRMVESMGGKLTEEIEKGFSTEYAVRLPRMFDAPVSLNLPQIKMPDFLSGKEGEPSVNTFTANDSVDKVSRPLPEEESIRKERKEKTIILLVEDNDDIRYYLKTCLDPYYHVEEAVNGLEGFEKAAEIVPDLIISDVMMPHVDGHTFCRQIKADEKLNHIPVILSTALAESQYHVEGLEAGADAYLIKPYESRVLLEHVRSLLANRRRLRTYYSDSIYIEPTGIKVPSVDAEFIKNVQAVVEEHMGDAAFDSGIFADALNMGERHLQRKFKSLIGMTPMKYVRIMRLKRAAQLLEQRGGGIAQTGFRVGFATARQFTRAFRAFHKMAPKEYRDNFRASGSQ